MDPVSLGAAAASMLAPRLPELLKRGRQVAGTVLEGLEGKAGELVKSLWDKLSGVILGKPEAEEAAEDVAAAPETQRFQDKLAAQLAELFRADPNLQSEVEPIVRQYTSVTGGTGSVTVVGSRNVTAHTVGGNLDGTTGDTYRGEEQPSDAKAKR